jgi:hypothetical protein
MAFAATKRNRSTPPELTAYRPRSKEPNTMVPSAAIAGLERTMPSVDKLQRGRPSRPRAVTRRSSLAT